MNTEALAHRRRSPRVSPCHTPSQWRTPRFPFRCTPLVSLASSSPSSALLTDPRLRLFHPLLPKTADTTDTTSLFRPALLQPFAFTALLDGLFYFLSLCDTSTFLLH